MKARLIIALMIVSINATAQKPSNRFLDMMVYDINSKQVLLYGGAGKNDTSFHDLWSLKDSHWKKLASLGPSSSIKCAFTYDPNRKRAVLFGGAGSKPMLDETWEWDGNKWIQIKINGPSARVHPMAAYDKKNKVIVLFGGVDATGLLSDTWIYDGISWRKENGNGPKNCLPTGMFYDDKKGSVILLTLISGPDSFDSLHSKNEMWQWTGSIWEKIINGDILTSLNSLQALAASNEGEIVLFDGDDKSKTWVFSNEKWVNSYSGKPSMRYGHAMVFDESTNKIYLFGGTNRREIFNDLWEWNGKQWNALTE